MADDDHGTDGDPETPECSAAESSESTARNTSTALAGQSLEGADSGRPETNRKTPEDDPETPEELLVRARRYAESVPLEVDLDAVEWEVSHRAKRRAGACIYRESSDVAVIRLTWSAYEAFGWEAFTETIRHELIHAHEFQTHGESGHGPRFRELADELDVSRHCPRFTEPRYWIVCDDCGNRIGRHRRSKLVDRPERYRCQCGGRLSVRDSRKAD